MNALRRLKVRRERCIAILAGTTVVFVALTVVLTVGSPYRIDSRFAMVNMNLHVRAGTCNVLSSEGDGHKTHTMARMHAFGNVDEVLPTSTSDTSTAQRCKASLLWPVLPAHVARKFDAPKNQWGPGHRGVDLTAIPGTPLLAPGTGLISFVGVVAGKNVVSIQSKAFTLTFEPAMTELVVGTPLVKGAPFATVGGISDHCGVTCVHWGVRRAIHDYTDPELLASKQKIVLKETDGS